MGEGRTDPQESGDDGQGGQFGQRVAPYVTKISSEPDEIRGQKPYGGQTPMELLIPEMPPPPPPPPPAKD